MEAEAPTTLGLTGDGHSATWMDLEGKRNSKTLKNIFKLKYFCLPHVVIETNVENIDKQEEENEVSWKFTDPETHGQHVRVPCSTVFYECMNAHTHAHTHTLGHYPDVCGDHMLPPFCGAGRGSSGSPAWPQFALGHACPSGAAVNVET